MYSAIGTMQWYFKLPLAVAAAAKPHVLRSFCVRLQPLSVDLSPPTVTSFPTASFAATGVGIQG
jgi:hypothetical protein